MIFAAAPASVETAVRHIQPVAGNGQRATLVLRAGTETHVHGAQRVGHIHRPARQHRAVGERQAEYEVPRSAVAIDYGVEIKRAASFVDHWRAGNAERVDVATRLRGARGRRAEALLPNRASGDSVQRHDRVLLSRDDYEPSPRARPTPVERLRVDVPWHLPVERRVLLQIGDVHPGQAGKNVMPAPSCVGVVSRHGGVFFRRSHRRSDQQRKCCHGGEGGNAHRNTLEKVTHAP